MTNNTPKPSRGVSLELRLQVLSAIDYAPGDTIKDRIIAVSKRTFIEPTTDKEYQFTWRTISTWLYRFKKNGITTLDKKTRSDKHAYRKVKVNELAEAINEILPNFSLNKVGKIPKMALYRALLERDYFHRSQLSQTSFYRMVRDNNLLDVEQTKKLRHSFSMQYANELWQADTMYGPMIKQPDGSLKRTFLIAFIDDASRIIAHAEFFYEDNTNNMIDAFRSALNKRGKPERLYFDNGSNYTSKEILQACVRLDIRLSHAPIRDGAAKGKIERFFRRFRDQFLIRYHEFQSLTELNEKTHQWVEDEYNSKPHSGIQMPPINRFNLDHEHIKFIDKNKHTDEVFYREENRKVTKTNVFSINSEKYECPVDLRTKTIQVRYDQRQRDRFIVYFNDKRMGEAIRLNQQFNAKRLRVIQGEKS